MKHQRKRSMKVNYNSSSPPSALAKELHPDPGGHSTLHFFLAPLASQVTGAKPHYCPAVVLSCGCCRALCRSTMSCGTASQIISAISSVVAGADADHGEGDDTCTPIRGNAPYLRWEQHVVDETVSGSKLKHFSIFTHSLFTPVKYNDK
ncbi:unnamed protein product [Amoebophrya sp. A120]|nr:unnamed protein product [Amoebophrya sp. A120]|eukprot:GSA120T00012181001.1